MKIAIKHGMTKEDALARAQLMMPALLTKMVEILDEAHAEFMALPRWRRWLLWAWAVPRHGPGWVWDKYRWWLRSRRRNRIGPNT